MKAYPWKCGSCRRQAMVPAVLDYVSQLDHDGRSYEVRVPALHVLRCNHCGTIKLPDEALTKLSEALRQKAGLLQPVQIRQNREALGLTQKQLASHLGVAEATLCRWETGAQIQQRSLDRLLRLYFAFLPVRTALADESSVPALGLGEQRPS